MYSIEMQQVNRVVEAVERFVDVMEMVDLRLQNLARSHNEIANQMEVIANSYFFNSRRGSDVTIFNKMLDVEKDIIRLERAIIETKRG